MSLCSPFGTASRYAIGYDAISIVRLIGVLELMPKDHPKMFYYHLSTALEFEYHLLLVKGTFFTKVEADIAELHTALSSLTTAETTSRGDDGPGGEL